MDIVSMLKEIMQKRNLNQEQLAEMLDVNPAQVSRWLDGAVPKSGNAMKIYKLYNGR